jgi:predicted acylesterase/phospholipase RssA
MKIGLILCGGSAKGISIHFATVSALRNLDIKPDVILGASAGSIVASFLATGMPAERMKFHMSTLRTKDFLDPLPKFELFKELIWNHGSKLYGFVKGDKLQEYVNTRITSKDDFSKAAIPLYVSATNLKTYKMTLFNTGSISEKVRASCAIPMMFCPKKIDTQYYIDGAIQKDRLPRALLSVQPDLDYIIVSNASYDDETDDNSYLENSKIPMVEIVRRTMVIQEKFSWPKKIGKTKLIYLTPGTTVPIDIFNIDPAIMNSVYQDSLKYATFHLDKYFRRIKQHQQRKEQKRIQEEQKKAQQEKVPESQEFPTTPNV